jgi:chromosome segregation ATPase
MRIKSIELINLRSYVDTKIELSENINLLIGANNSGKSTIIKALLIYNTDALHQTMLGRNKTMQKLSP